MENLDMSEDSEENSQKLFSLFSKKILFQFSKEKFGIESELRKHYEEEVRIKKESLERETALRREQLENKLKLEYEEKWKRKCIENERILKEREKDLVKEFFGKSDAIEGKWKEELDRLSKEYEKSLLEKDEEYREKEIQFQKKQFVSQQDSRQEYEESVKSKYEELMRQYQEEVDRILNNGEEENEKLRLKLKQEKAEFEMATFKKFQKMIEQKEKDVKVLLTDRENQLLNYDHQKNLKLMKQLKEKEEERIRSETRLQGRYEAQLEELKKISRQQIDTLLAQIDVLKTEKLSEQREANKLEAKIREISHNVDMWKVEYHKSTMKKFQTLLYEIELQSKKEMEKFARNQIKQYESHLLLELKQKDHELRKYEKQVRELKEVSKM